MGRSVVGTVGDGRLHATALRRGSEEGVECAVDSSEDTPCNVLSCPELRSCSGKISCLVAG